MEANDNKIRYQFFDEQGKSHTVDQSEYDGRANDYARLYPKDQMRMVDKHGQSGLVPAREVDTAIKQGYRPFTISYSTPAPIQAPSNSVQPIGQTMENKAREEQAQLQKPIQQIQKTVDKEFNSQPATVNLGKGNVPAVPTPIQPQKPLKDIISDSDKEFNTSIAPKIDSFISQHNNAALKEMRSNDGLLSANQYAGAMAAKGQRYMSEIDAQNVLNDVRNYIGQKTGNGKGGNGVDPHTDRIMQRTIDYLAKKDMPKSSVEYILKNMIDGSLVGTIGNAVLGKSSTQQEVEQRGNELYNPSWVEKGAAGAGAMALDAPIFGGLGGISSKAFKLGTKALTKHVAGQLAEKAGEKVISNATLEQAGRIVSQNTPKMIAQRIGMNAAESASTLGMYNTADDAINQAIQINNGSQDKYSLKQTAKSGLSGILMGGAFGVTDGAFAGVSRNMTGLKRVGTEIGGLASSAAVGTGVSTLEKYAQGEPVDIGEDYLTNIAMFGAMKLPHVGNINLKSADPKDREILKSTLAFTPEQKGELKNAGYDANHLVSTIAQLSANKKQKATTVEGQRNVSLIEDTNRDRELFGKEYAKIMQNPGISLSTKSKLLYLVEGKLAMQPAITGYKTSTDEKGETILTTNDWADRVIDKKAFKNNKDANTYIQKNNLLDNSIRNSIAFSEQLNDRAVEGAYKRQAIRNVATKYGISSDDISKIIADKADGKILPENGNKILDEIKWTVESDPEFIKRTSAAKAQDVKDTTGIDVNDALKKNKAERTEDEEKAISMYTDKLQKGFRTEEEPKDDNTDSVFDSNKQIEDTKGPTVNNVQQHDEENKVGDDTEEQILSNANKEGKILRVQTFGGDIVNVVDGHLEFDENGKVDLSKSDPEIYYKDQDGRTKVAPTENTVSNLVDETDANELAAQTKQDTENNQPIENSSEEPSINTLVPIDKDQQKVSNEQEDIQTQPQENAQSYLDRIPKDNEGNPLFEHTEPENTAGALLEMNDGDNTEAIDTAKQMSSNYESEIKKLEKKPPIGKSVIEIQNAKKQKKEELTRLQNLYDYWNGISDLLEQTPTNPTAVPQSVEEHTPTAEVNDQDYKEKTLTDKPKRIRGFYSKENDDMGTPNSLREAVVREIATGGYKFQWKDNENNRTKGLASHLGLKGDESERRGMIGFLSAPDNGGLPPEVVAEKIKGDLGDMFPATTDQDIFNEILDVFHTYGGSRKNMWEEAKKLHGQTEEDDPEYQAYLEDIHHKVASSYHMAPEEYDLYNEYIPHKIEEENNTMTDNDYSDFLSTLAEQYNKEENDSRRENIHGQLPEVETVQRNNSRSGPILHGDENSHGEGYTNSERPRQGGNAEPDKYDANSLPDSKISGEPELANKELEKQKDIFEKPSLDENKEVSLNQNNKNDGREIQQRTDEREPVLQQISQGEHGEVPERNGGLEQTTGELDRRCRIYEAELSRSGKTLSVEERKEIERRTAEDFAKEKGLWIPMNEIFDLGVPGPSGNENDTYISGNDIYKVNNLMNSDSIVSLLNKTSLHNKIFPNTKYDFVGFTGFDKRNVFPVLKQRLILNAVPASPEEIKSYMESLGFKETGEAIYSNGKITISDLRPRNVLKSESGNIYVIDDEIKEADSSFVSPEKKRDESILNYADRIAAAKELHDEENKVVTNPTDAQKEAGNYKKGHIKIDGFDITIENPKGSVRSGTDANGNKWETQMHNTYGYIRGTKGVDGDHIDVYLSDDPTEGDVFVIDQINPNTGEFDEHKVMYGFKSALAAKRAYLSNYEKDWKGLGNITHVSKEDFKKWVDSSHRKTKPFSEYSSIKTKNESNIDQRQNNSLSLNNQKTEGNDNSTTIRDSQSGSIKEPLGGIVAKGNGVLQSDRPLLNEPAVNNGNNAAERRLSDKTSDRDGTNRELSPIGSDGSNQSRNDRDNQVGGQRSDRRGSQSIRDGKIGRGVAKTTPNLFGELQENKPQLEKNSTEYQKSNPKNTRNYLLPSDAKDITGYSESTIAKDNIRAIEIIRDLLKEHREATSREREELGKFHGWGGLNIATAYSPYKMNAVQSGNFEKLENLCKEIDPDKKLNVRESIRRAALTSYYTPISLARTINDFIQKAGFKGGSLFDPSMGVGIFESTMSKSVQQNTSIHGVELDFLTGMISKHLFPDARIQVVGLQDAGISNNSNDVVVSNIPFGDIKVTDPSWKNNSNPIYRVAQLRIHNYFTVKMIDATKPGGLCVIVTSNAVLDTPNNRIVRQYIANNTEFLGAVRLPDNMFKSAGTKVVTDVLFLRKYKEGEIHTPPSFLELKDKDIDGTKLSYNEYYHIHPNNMIGNIVAGGQYRDDTFGLVSDLTTDEISAKVKKLSGKFINSEVIDTKKSERVVNKQLKASYKGNGNFERSGNIIIQDGKIGYLTTEKDDFGQSSLKFVPDTKLSSLGERAVSYIKLRNSLKELMYAELSEENDIAKLRKNMNDNYSSFKDSFGRLGDKKNDFIANDIDGYTVRGLEQYKDGKFKGLADIFVKNTISPIRERMTATDPKEAINISLSEYGTIKESKMKHILGDNWEELCGDMIYHVPFSEDIQTKDEYLSGNVKYKLEDAERAAKTNNKFERNVEALKKVIPADIPASLISIRMGARWLPTDIYSQFAADDLGCTNSEVMYLEGIDDFKVKLHNTYNSKCDRFKTGRKSVQDIFEAAIGDKTITVYDTEKSIGGSETKTLNKKETDAANEKVSELRSEFEEWITKDAKRADKIQRLYNDKFNCNVLRHYDGSHLEVPGLQGLSLRPHQKDAVWMILQNGGGIIDHIVGAGKTLVMQTAIMEMRRMGIANKPMIIALKSTVNQMVKEFHDAYPMANILAPTDKDFSKENRKKFLSNIALNEYDCIILSHEQYCQLDHTPEVESETLNEQMAQLDASLQYLYGAEQKSELSKRQIKGLEKRKASLEAKLKEINDRKVDKEFTFENLGIDYLFVDESHQFKNLQYFTSYQNVAGLGDPSGNKKTQALLNGIRYLQKLHQGDKGVTFCSGTTITNSMVELYNLLNYLRPNEMRRLGLNTFDAWASNFADRSSELEFGVTNQLKAKNRFRRYINVPELSKMYAEIADVRNDNNLILPKPKAREHMVAIEPNDEMENVNSEIINMVNSKNGSFFNITPEDSNKAPWSLHATRLSAMNAIDPRLIDESYSDSPSSKISKAASNIADIYHKFDKQKGIQLVFTDLGTPNKNKFNVYDELIRKLVEDFEINRNEIAKIHDYDTEQKRKELFAKAKDGEIRVIIGGTKKLGTGVNVQDRVVAIHHIDVPWTPSSLDQRNGRGVRQGNIIARDFNDNNVDIYYYATERSLDAYKYQLLQTKKSFIDQVKDNTVGDREIDEGEGDEDNGFSYAAVVSVLSGNPIIFEKAKVDKKVDELRRKKRIYDEDLSRRIYNYNDAKQSYENIQKFKKANEKDIEKLKTNGFISDSKGTYPSAISIYHNGKVYSNFERPKDAGKRLLDLISKSGTITIESYGFKAKIDKPTIKEGIFGKYTLVITGEGGIPYQQEISDDPTYAGVSMRSLLLKIINSNDKYNKELSRLSGMLEGGKPEQVPFKKQAELDEAIKKQVELAKELEKLSNPDQNERFRIRETQMQTRISPEDEIISSAKKFANTFHTKINIIHPDDINGNDDLSIYKRNAKGWYDTKTDEVYINPQNHIDEEDVKQTILHEVVAHKGLRKLLGDSFDDTMNDIFRSLPESERKEISNIFLNSNSWNTAEAAEEYCARLAESGIDKPSIWKTIISKIRELLRKAGIKIKMSDNDIKYLLWKSRRHLEDTPDNYSKEFKVKDNIYKDDFVDNRKATPLFRLDPQKLSEKDFNDIIGITKEVAMLNEEEKNDFIKRMEHQVLFESWIDKMNPIRVFQETVAKKYETEIPDECNAHLSYLTMTSRARYEKDIFKSIVFDKMLSAVNKVGKYDDVINYLIAKHGLERNVYMREQKIEEAIAPLKEQISQIDYLLSRHSISEEEADAQRKSLESKIKKIATKITEDFANEDFAGLTQLQKELQDDDSELKDIKLNEPYIQNFVDEFEKSHDKDDISGMWDNIHEATNFCLETQRRYGCISKERMEQIKAMYNYYVPLRDWADPQAEDFFTYFYKDRHNLNIPIQKAKGRKTKAGDPIANIGSMADSAIVLGNKNRVKQHLYRLVFNYPTNLAHVSPVWVAWNPNTLTYEEVAFEGIDSKGNPLDGENYDTAFEEWNNRMKSLAKQNIVVQKNEKLSIGVPIKAWQAKQHQVRLTINGKDYIINMDSSPRVAQAINGDNIDEGMQAFQKLKNATNWMARNFTSKMINFVFRNFFRDYTGAITYNSIYGYSSMKDFLAATPKASKVLAEYLTTKKMPEGKYGQYFDEFLKNGGETGYTNSMSYKDYFKEIQNEIDKVKHPTKLHFFRWIGNAMEILNRGAEDTTRLSAYIASRESDKSIMQSINAAKEISVNFNRMGSGRNGNSFIRAWEMFFNAGLQAVYNTVRGFKYHPVKSTIAFGTWTLIGAMKGILQSIYGDDKYYQLPDWIRQNNFTISVGGDMLLNIPLALEIRPFFAMGDILAQVVLGKYHDKNAVTDIATKFMEAAPYNFMEGSNSKGDTFEQILANTLAPSAVKPFIDVYWTNKDYTGRPISKRNEFNEYVPEYKKGYRSTSDLAIAISKSINDLSGGDMAKKGALDSELTNPAVMEYLFNNYGGGVLKQIYGIAKSGYNLVTPGKDVEVRDIPAVSALLYKFDNSKGNSNINERYYKYLDEYEENQSQDREYTKSIMSSEKGAVEHYFNKKANLENEKDMQIIGMYKKIIETIQQKAKSIPDGDESDQLQKQIYGLKKAMVEQLEK